jgi:hypothetical protein
MEKAAGDVEKIARLQHNGHRGRADGVNVRVERLAVQRQSNRGIENRPLFRPRDLKHKNVMRIVVRIEALAARRRHVEVGLRRRTDFALKLATQGRQRSEPLLRIPNHECRPAGEKLASSDNIEGGIREGGVCPSEFAYVQGSIRIRQTDGIRRKYRDQRIDLLDREERSVVVTTFSTDEERLFLPIFTEERRRRDGVEEPGQIEFGIL